MTAREYLKQLQNLDMAINSNIATLEAMRLAATGQGAIQYDRERVMTSPQDRLCDDICDILTLNEHINEQIDRFVDLKGKIIGQIIGLSGDQDQRDILMKVYVEYKTNRQVAYDLKKSMSFVFAMKAKALKMFERQYPQYLV